MSTQNIVDRLSNALNCKTDKELSDFLEVRRTTLSSWRSKSSIPIEKLTDIARKYDLSLDYLVFGKEQEKRLSTDINIQILKEVVFEYEMVYKAMVENDKTAQWMWFDDFSPEDAKKTVPPKEEDLQLVTHELNQKSNIAGVIGNLYNAVINEPDEEERKKTVRYNTSVGTFFIANSEELARKILLHQVKGDK